MVCSDFAMRMGKSVLWTTLIGKDQLILLRQIIFALSCSSRAFLTLLFRLNGSGLFLQLIGF